MTQVCSHRSKAMIVCDRKASAQIAGQHLCGLHALEKQKGEDARMRLKLSHMSESHDRPIPALRGSRS